MGGQNWDAKELATRPKEKKGERKGRKLCLTKVTLKRTVRQIKKVRKVPIGDQVGGTREKWGKGKDMQKEGGGPLIRR